ncbi:MAG: tyrosine-type recombinase/integrase [Solirubrobacteraceae bacterium]
MARRAAHSGSARARRARPRPAARVAARPQRQGRSAPRDRHGRLGLGAAAPLAGRPPRTAGGPLFCVIDGPTRGRPWSSANVRVEFRRLAAQAGIRRRFAPHQLRHAHAVELAREGVPLNVIQRQLGHADLGTTSIYLQGIDTEEIIATAHARRAPMMSASAGLQL